MDKYSRYKELREVRDVSIAKESKYFIIKDLPDCRYFKERSCPLCNSQNNVNEYIIKNEAGNTFTKCKHCEMVYMNPVLKEDIYSKYYTDSAKTTAKKIVWDKNIENFKPIPKPLKQTRYDLLLKYTNGGRLLDFGCGFGKVPDTVKFYFDEIEGIEIDGFCASVAKNVFGLKVYNDFIEKLNIEDRYDACVMYNSIEHLLDPKNTLKYIRRALKSGGKLFVECPNSESISMRLFKGKHHLSQSTEHVNLFSIKALDWLLQDSGFTIMEKKTRKVDVLFNDFLVWLLKRPQFYHRISDRLINNKYYDVMTNCADTVIGRCELLMLKAMSEWGSYCQVVALKK